jgi:hypothetical protein
MALVSANAVPSTDSLLKINLDSTGKPVSHLPTPEAMSDRELLRFVRDGSVNIAILCEQFKPYYIELRDRFNRKPKDKKIEGYRTWNEYCTKVLDRTKRAVNYFLAGGNPTANRKPKSATPRQAAQTPTYDSLHPDIRKWVDDYADKLKHEPQGLHEPEVADLRKYTDSGVSMRERIAIKYGPEMERARIEAGGTVSPQIRTQDQAAPVSKVVPTLAPPPSR